MKLRPPELILPELLRQKRVRCIVWSFVEGAGSLLGMLVYLILLDNVLNVFVDLFALITAAVGFKEASSRTSRC